MPWSWNFDKLLLSALFLLMVLLATAFGARSEKLFDLCSDCAAALLGALLVLITRKETKR